MALELEESKFDWEELMGTDIRVKYIQKNMANDIASFGTIVTCNFKTFVANSTVPLEELENQRFKIGDGDAVPGLELPLRHSRVGDHFLISCSSKFAFGPSGRPEVKPSKGSAIASFPAILPDTDLVFDVTILAHNTEDNYSIGSREHAEFILSVRKECGNRWFSYGDYSRAARAYSKGAEAADGYLKSIVESSSDNALNSVDETVVVELYLACLNNLAACYLSKGENLKAKEVCIRVLELDPRNIKGLLRAARAALALHEFEETEACLKRVLELEPTNAVAVVEYGRLKTAKKKYSDSSKEMARKMTKQLFSKATVAEGPSGVNTATVTATAPSSGIVLDAEALPTDNVMDKLDGKDAIGVDEPLNHNSAASTTTQHEASAVMGKTEDSKLEPPRAYSMFMLLFTSLAIVVVSIVVAFFAAGTAS